MDKLNVITLEKRRRANGSDFVSSLVQRILCDCGRTFSERRYFKYHKLWECGRLLRCGYCSREFNTKSNLTQHTKKCKILEAIDRIEKKCV